MESVCYYYNKYRVSHPLLHNDWIVSLFFSSDIVVQIVDARNPLLFRCEDLVSKVLLISLKQQREDSISHSSNCKASILSSLALFN
jgi:hypothetical protein